MSLSCPNLRKVVNVSTTALKFDTYGNIGQVSALPLHPSNGQANVWNNNSQTRFDS